jgi:putative copper export protein
MSPIAERALVQWPLAAGEILIFGTAAFTLAIAPGNAAERGKLRSVLGPLSRALSIVILFFSPLGLLIAASEMADLPFQKTLPLLPEVMAQTHVGRIWAWRLGLAVVLVVSVWFTAEWLPQQIAVLTVSAALVLCDTLCSHAIDKGAPALAVYFLHEIAAALWVGALLSLWVGFVRSELNTRWKERAAQRVSQTAGYAVGLLVLTGIYNAYSAIGLNPGHLLYTTYGRTLLFKLGLFAVVLGIGAYNRYRLVPAAAAAGSRRLLLRNVSIESVLLIGVLGLAALLANTPPPHHGVGRNGHSMMMM